jgi:hypothetical protein
MERENVPGMMALIMRDSGWVGREMARGYILKKMEFFLRANGQMIKNMDKVK